MPTIPPFEPELARTHAGRLDNRGFTLLELLVAIAIVGVLAAIALPTYLNQLKRARESEARVTLGAIVRAQQAYRLEQASYADSLASLQQTVVSLDLAQEYYSYEILHANPTEMSAAAAPLSNDFDLDSFCIVLQLDGHDAPC